MDACTGLSSSAHQQDQQAVDQNFQPGPDSAGGSHVLATDTDNLMVNKPLSGAPVSPSVRVHPASEPVANEASMTSPTEADRHETAPPRTLPAAAGLPELHSDPGPDAAPSSTAGSHGLDHLDSVFQHLLQNAPNGRRLV